MKVTIYIVSYRQKQKLSHLVPGPLYIIIIVDHKINAYFEKFIEKHSSDTCLCSYFRPLYQPYSLASIQI